MINFKGGLIKYGSEYIPTKCITKIKGNDFKTFLTLKDQISDPYGNSEIIREQFEGSVDTWVNAYVKAEKIGDVVDVMI